MKINKRAATFAAVTFCISAMFTATSPSLAVEVATQVPSAASGLSLQELPAPLSDPSPAESTAQPVFAPRAEIAQPIPVAQPAVETRTSAADDQDYDSLAEAVAAQDAAVSDDEELKCLAIGVYFEAKSEPLAGQLAVADVILNRAQSGRFPKSVCSVLKQPGQFSFVNGGRLPSIGSSKLWRTALAVARVARAELWDSPVPQALYFHAKHVAPRWNRVRVASLGNHVFYR